MLKITGLKLTENVVGKKCKEILDALYYLEQIEMVHGYFFQHNFELN